ncbi:hypothetical protein SAMN05421837_12066 [Amycolatopsis pretoriensis]|uniref:Uncharacterized protein n=1 Tax=Amycolatopsis pretoriensis TaxID=218821 RepID=A0A1H5RLF0_9PSEU|nr:hypothetical protein [Amycolatopsis pretoriensis]SEF38341.1 hypothetical protein SAMN05421837_12066 [Amycolatopsis pretoriensis]
MAAGNALAKLKQTVYAEYLRSISASYGQAIAGERSLAGTTVSRAARKLTTIVLAVHSRVAAGDGVEEAIVAAVDEERLALVEIFKTDLKIEP